ncbi:hypothetical protein HOP50_13g68360 [Chloropicon primus]|nr:hypothetical protein HOP50_13g68360 [Chloropicon primus]
MEVPRDDNGSDNILAIASAFLQGLSHARFGRQRCDALCSGKGYGSRLKPSRTLDKIFLEIEEDVGEASVEDLWTLFIVLVRGAKERVDRLAQAVTRRVRRKSDILCSSAGGMVTRVVTCRVDLENRRYSKSAQCSPDC